MNSLLDRILSIKSLSTGAEGVEFHLARPVPAWAWLLIALVCLAWAAWTYARLLGPAAARSTLALLRTGLLLLVALLVTGPQLVRQNERIEPDWVLMLIDRSASMGVADVQTAQGRQTRDAQLRAALAAAQPALADLDAKRHVLTMGFDAGAFDLPITAGLPDLAPPTGPRTSLSVALEQALKRAAGRPVAGVVILSDGRSPDQPSRAVLRQLQSRKIPVLAVPLGSDTAPTDLAVARIEAPSLAFIRDLVPISVTIDRLGGQTAPAAVRLVDRATGEVLDERRLDPADPEPLTLTARRDQAGTVDWAVEVRPDSPDLSPDNNSKPLRIEFVDRPIRVVYIDGYPRWEYRYLKDLLVREDTIRSATMMLAADRRYLQEGSEPLGALPRTREEWNAIDVVLLGDVRPSLFSEQQLTNLRDLVAQHGAGLIWIAGPAYTPSAWRATPGADLLPFSLGADGGSSPAGGPRPWPVPVLMRSTPAAGRYAILQLGETPGAPWPPELTDAALGWPTLRWAQRIEPTSLKPTTEVLATAEPLPSGEPAPLVMTMRYGAGRIAYVATDETWRYRYGKGQTLTERFWLPLIRLAARDSLSRTGKPALLTVSPDHALTGQQVQVTLRLVDQTYIDKRPELVRVRVHRDRAGDNARPAEIVLRPIAGEEGAPATFQGLWSARDPGTYRVEPADALLEGLDLAATLDVALPDDELRTPQSDHPALAALAEATQGHIVPPDHLADIASMLPNREVRLLGAPDIETLWDKPIAWIFLISLLTLEWVGRRLIKLA